MTSGMRHAYPHSQSESPLLFPKYSHEINVLPLWSTPLEVMPNVTNVFSWNVDRTSDLLLTSGMWPNVLLY